MKKKGFRFLHFSFIADILGFLGYVTISLSLGPSISPINKSGEGFCGVHKVFIMLEEKFFKTSAISLSLEQTV